jgi:aldehyde:ferredoxin oxidoreductase
LRGWNAENGWPTREKLEELDLADVAEGLEAVGKLG